MVHRMLISSFNPFVSGLLVVGLFAQMASAQTPSKEAKPSVTGLDQATINDHIRFAREALSRQRPQIPHVRVGWRQQEAVKPGVAPTQDIQPATTKTETRGQNATARTIVVTTTADDGTGSLRQAIADASNRDTINITATGTIALTSGELLVNKSVTIRGPGAANLSVSSGGASRVFHITPTTVVTISRVTIADGKASNEIGVFPASAGGGIYSDHARLTVSGCTVSGNSARYGGGVFSNVEGSNNGSLALINSTVSGNAAISSGGGVLNDGENGDANLIVTNTVISGNSADFGAGIFNDGFAGSALLTLNSSSVTQNLMTHVTGFFPAGGGVYNNGDSGVATAMLSNATLTGNSPQDTCPPACFLSLGGAIFNDGSSSVSPGSATLEVSNGSIDGNSANGGGGIENVGSISLSNTSISGNFGGGISNVGGAATLNNCVINGNDNSGIINSGPATLRLVSSTVTNNHSDLVGGGIFNAGATALLKSSFVTGNAAPVAGGGIENVDGSLTLTDSTVGNNSALGGGGGIDNYTDRGGATATLNNSTVSGNSAPGISNYANVSRATLTIVNSTVSGNSYGCNSFCSSPGGINNASAGGGATATLNNSTVSGNLGWGIFNIVFNYPGSASVAIANTILNAGTSSGTIVSVDINGAITLEGITSQGYNLSSDAAFGDNSTSPGGLLNGTGDIRNTNPLLGPLQNNGGLTMTHALLLGSPAIDAGDPNFDPKAFDPPLRRDQRDLPGFRRVSHGRLDIGAFEFKQPGEGDEPG